MTQPFFTRLRTYYTKAGAVLRGEADSATIFPNGSDIGLARERIYAEFLRTHLPSSCNVSFGGFVFGQDGMESRQIDLLITADSSPRYDFHNVDGDGKTFTCIDGLLAVASIKSTLSSSELINSLENLASLPRKSSLEGKVLPQMQIPNYDDWPFKIIYASDGASLETIIKTLTDFYRLREDLQPSRRPNLIHVAGKYNIVRVCAGGASTRDGTHLAEHSFYAHPDPTDVFALAYAVQNIQMHAICAKNILFSYNSILDRISF